MADDEQRPSGGAPWMRPPSVPGPPAPGAMPPPATGPADPAAGEGPAAVGPNVASAPPTFVSPSAAVLGGRTAYGAPPPAGPGGPGDAGGGPTGGGGGRDFAHLLGAHHDEEPGERPLPSIAGAVGAAAGVLVVVGLLAILSDADGDNIRATGILLSMLYEVGGIAVLLFTQSRRAVSGAVAISALTVLPLVTYLVVDVDHPLKTFDSPDSFRNVQMEILALSLVAWLALYLVGPGRRHGLYLGGALYALWSLPVTYISATSLQSTLGGLDLGDVAGTGSGSSDGLDALFGSGSGSGSGMFDDPQTTALALGLVSLVIGLAYLAIGVLLDRGDDHRRGTPFFALAPLVLGSSLMYLSARYGMNWICLLGLLLGGAEIAAGTLGRRRFTTWIGGVSVAGALLGFAMNNIDDAVPAGIALTMVGLTLIVALAIAEGAMGWGPSARAGGPDHPPADTWGPPPGGQPPTG